ncbi:Holliday junction resolvase RuvX [Dokdonella sp.]|uniref:Holliday junction resolvase RuvX n=1 Tax=Dokdonella sp. TaxID=2291710 RepID=UPI0031C70356|nr:Holliday junction resolvase RuvX [Dokdonella sp.]
MPATPEPAGGEGSILAFDYGARLIGVAVGHRLTASARSLGTLATGDWDALDRLVDEWQPACLVVGLPLALDGSEQPMSAAARRFAAALEQRHNLPVQLVDERLSSHAAARRFAARRAAGSARRKHAAGIDGLAAEVILEDWLAQA